MSALRTELPEAPARILRLPVHRGYPVPWFVGWLKDGEEVPRGEGTPDFRVIASGAIASATENKRCWICGDRLGVHVAFTIGPMCAVNRISAEPPGHVECAEWSAKACPFLSRPNAVRREGGLPDDAEAPAGEMIARNPGVALVWVTRRYSTLHVPPKGVLFRVGEPERVTWIREGRPATRAEVEDAIESGLPFLRERAEEQGPFSVLALERQCESAARLYPDPDPDDPEMGELPDEDFHIPGASE